MNNNQNNFDLKELEGKSFKDYLALVQKNLWPFLIISLVIIIGTAFYVLRLTDIYMSETSVKISKSGGSILQTTPLLGMGDLGNDRMINNEIEILKSFDLRKIVANTLLDSFAQSKSKDDFKLLYKSESNFGRETKKLY